MRRCGGGGRPDPRVRRGQNPQRIPRRPRTRIEFIRTSFPPRELTCCSNGPLMG